MPQVYGVNFDGSQVKSIEKKTSPLMLWLIHWTFRGFDKSKTVMEIFLLHYLMDDSTIFIELIKYIVEQRVIARVISDWNMCLSVFSIEKQTIDCSLEEFADCVTFAVPTWIFIFSYVFWNVSSHRSCIFGLAMWQSVEDVMIDSFLIFA